MKITRLGERLIALNIENFYNIQKDIAIKFKLPDDTFFNNLDKYLGQILEEISEISDSNNDKDRIDEIVDTLMYIGSAMAYVNMDSENNDIMFMDTDILISFENNKESVTDFCCNLFNKIIRIRRLFPERKWHKPHIDKNAFYYNDEDDKKILVLELFRDTIKYIINFVENNYGLEIFEKELLLKQNYIRSL